MVVLVCGIEIEPFERAKFTSEIEIKSGFKDLTDTATLKFPKKVKLESANLRTLLKKGNKVEIQLGYDGKVADDAYGEVYTEFVGVISEVKPGIPFEIRCEDEMWFLKQVTVTQSFASISLKALLAFLISKASSHYKREFLFECKTDVDLGKLRIVRCSIAQVLAELKTKYGIYSFFADGKLHSGLPYLSAFEYRQGHADFHFQKNIVSSNLTYKSSEDRKISVKATSILPNNDKIEVEGIGDAGGEERTLTFFNIKSKQALRDIAESEMKKLKLDGYQGSITGFGSPYVRHGYSIGLQDAFYPEREGSYNVEQTIVRFGQSGFRREIFLGHKVSTK